MKEKMKNTCRRQVEPLRSSGLWLLLTHCSGNTIRERSQIASPRLFGLSLFLADEWLLPVFEQAELTK